MQILFTNHKIHYIININIFRIDQNECVSTKKFHPIKKKVTIKHIIHNKTYTIPTKVQ